MLSFRLEELKERRSRAANLRARMNDQFAENSHRIRKRQWLSSFYFKLLCECIQPTKRLHAMGASTLHGRHNARESKNGNDLPVRFLSEMRSSIGYCLGRTMVTGRSLPRRIGKGDWKEWFGKILREGSQCSVFGTIMKRPVTRRMLVS